MRLRLDLAYDGTAFHGWATQPGLRTVQELVEERIGQLLSLSGTPSLVAAGRTDAGVHARGQVCHLDLPEEAHAAQRPGRGHDLDLSAYLYRRLRRALPSDVVVKAVSPALPGFHARYSAIWRRYCYRLLSADSPPDPLRRGHVVSLRHTVDIDRLNAAATAMIGLRDFAPFCKPRVGATTIRDLRQLSATRHSDGLIEIHLMADAFCHSMVRSLVGAITAVGAGRRDLAWLEQVAASPVRHGEILVMPSRGLTFEEVGYPADDGLAARALEARATRSLEDLL